MNDITTEEIKGEVLNATQKRASYSTPSTSTLYAMYEPAIESFYEASAEVRSAARDMSADEMRAAVDDLYAAADINYTPTEAEDFENLYTIKNGVATIPVKGMLVNTINPCAAFFGEVDYRICQRVPAQLPG